MSKLLLAAALLAVIGFGACNKDDSDPTVPDTFVDKGYIKYQNNSADEYYIYLDGQLYGTLYGGDTVRYPRIPVGGHTVKSLQKEHIVNNAPVLREQTVIVYKDSTTTFAFP